MKKDDIPDICHIQNPEKFHLILSFTLLPRKLFFPGTPVNGRADGQCSLTLDWGPWRDTRSHLSHSPDLSPYCHSSRSLSQDTWESALISSSFSLCVMGVLPREYMALSPSLLPPVPPCPPRIHKTGSVSSFKAQLKLTHLGEPPPTIQCRLLPLTPPSLTPKTRFVSTHFCFLPDADHLL